MFYFIWLIVIFFFPGVFLGGENFSLFKLGGSVLKLFYWLCFMKIFKEKIYSMV